MAVRIATPFFAKIVHSLLAAARWQGTKVSHPFGDLLTQYLHRKHGLSQAKLAAGILQTPSIISDMSGGKRLSGPQARQRVTAIIAWLQQQGALITLDDANALLNAAGMSPLQERDADEALLIRKASAHVHQQQPSSLDTRSTSPRLSSGMPRHNLPPPLTPFIGRAEQIAQLVQHLQTRRLLTLTGAGGVGKTRLALEVATQLSTRFADGLWFVDLAPITDSETVFQRILDLWHVPGQPDRSLQAMLTAYLHTKQLLLILDNCEHLLDTCAELAEMILQHCPQVSLLATSREALNLRAEMPWRVPSLTRPHANSGWHSTSEPTQPPLTPAALVQFEATTLFLERAYTHQSSFALTVDNAPSVAHICSRLDGIPLALEMAAARVNVLTVEELATQLDGAFDARFQLLTSGARTAPFRHQTLRATLEWSYALLTPAEQHLLRNLSVFSGGWTAAAAEDVAGSTLELLAQLVNKSLVVADQRAGQTRYHLLETVRQFAAEQPTHTAQMQHGHYYLRLLGAQEEQLAGHEQRMGLSILRADLANISVAWRWAVDQQAFELLVPAVHALFLFCDASGGYRTGVTLFAHAATGLQAAMADSAPNQPTLLSLWGQVTVRLGACEVELGNYQRGEQYLQDALQLITMEQERAFALGYLGLAACEQGELTLARTQLNESLLISQRYNDCAGMAQALYRLSGGLSDHAEACRLAAESLMLWRQVGRPNQIAHLLGYLAWHLFCLGDYSTADAYWREDLTLCEQLDLPNEKAWALDCMGFAAWCQGEMPTAEQSLRAALVLYTELGRQSTMGMCKAELALVLSSIGQVRQAITMAQDAVAITRAVNSQMMLTVSLNYLGAVLVSASDFVAARATLLEAIQRGWQNQYFFFMMTAFYYFAELLVREPDAPDRPAERDRKVLAVTVLSCVRAQAATWQAYKDKAAQLQVEIENELPPEARAIAIIHGQGCTLHEMVSTLLGDVPEVHI